MAFLLPPPPTQNLLQVIPITLEEQYSVNLAFWITSIFQWIFFVWSKFADPGLVKINRQSYDEAVKLVCLYFVAVGNPV